MKKKSLILKIFPVSILLVFLLSIPIIILAPDTVVKGVITDEEGKPLKGAKVTFHDSSRGLKFNIKTDKNGNFIKAGIPPSFYKVTVELEGYFPLESQARIRFGFTEQIAIKLKKIPPRIDEDKDLDQGTEYFRQGKLDEAMKAFEKVIERFPSNVEGYYNLGLTYLRKGDIDQAISTLEKCIEVNPEVIETHLALGECYFSKGEGEKAIQSFLKAIEFQPDNPKSYYNLGIVYYKLDKTEEALGAFDKSIELNPEHPSAYYQAGLAAIKKGDFERAIKYFESFLKVEPDASEANQVKAMIKELKKQIK